MFELYTLTYGVHGVQFTPREDADLVAALVEDSLVGYSVQATLGDDALLDCRVLRKDKDAGGLFIIEDDMDVLMVVVADTNLTYVEGINHFAEVVAQARYALDIYENQDADEDE